MMQIWIADLSPKRLIGVALLLVAVYAILSVFLVLLLAVSLETSLVHHDDDAMLY